MPNVPDPELFDRLVGFWCAMEPSARPALLQEAWKMASPGWAPAVERSARGKAQG